MRALTRKQQAFVNHLIEHPKDSGTKAALATTNATTAKSASVYAAATLAKPSVISHLEAVGELAEEVIQGVMQDWKRDGMPRKRELAMQAAFYAHDKIHGKATQRVEVQSHAVVISVDLSGSMLPDDSDTTDSSE